MLVVVDHLGKYAHFLLLSHPFSAKTMANLFIREVVQLHGFPKLIVSDRDEVFVSKFWVELFNIQRTMFKVFVSKLFRDIFEVFCNEQPKQWSHWIPWAEYWYNTTFHGSIKTTPYQALYGVPHHH